MLRPASVLIQKHNRTSMQEQPAARVGCMILDFQWSHLGVKKNLASNLEKNIESNDILLVEYKKKEDCIPF